MLSRALKWRSEHEGKRKEGKKGKEEREKKVKERGIKGKGKVEKNQEKKNNNSPNAGLEPATFYSRVELHVPYIYIVNLT